ncbi:30979_t:CDS:2 [Gigaspora margarita]|uniref:30979_t:CDS:1 n=1 Tax=Gigaspora margarita TaxID=4874 RepID=A0ABN7U9Y0_GIGMA|nr:30979_t:CDS:2 [Gigaspora margarita]
MGVYKYKHQRRSPSRKKREKVLGEYSLVLKKSRKRVDLEAQVVDLKVSLAKAKKEKREYLLVRNRELEEKILSLKKNKELEEKSLSIEEKEKTESRFEGYKRFKKEEVEKLKKELKEVKIKEEDIGRWKADYSREQEMHQRAKEEVVRLKEENSQLERNREFWEEWNQGARKIEYSSKRLLQCPYSWEST